MSAETAGAIGCVQSMMSSWWFFGRNNMYFSEISVMQLSTRGMMRCLMETLPYLSPEWCTGAAFVVIIYVSKRFELSAVHESVDARLL